MSGWERLAKKSLGQHWLFDEAALEAMCLSAKVDADDVVLEIGPGLGTLTHRLVKKAKQVVAVEFDDELANALPMAVSADNLQVLHEDILKFDFTTLPPDYKVVANIPYYLTSHLLRLLSEISNPPSAAALLVQKEVAERVAAPAGDMSVLSVTTQYYYEPELGRLVKAELFSPPPKVDSQILILKHRPEPLFPDAEPREFFRVVKAGFGERRKKLSNSVAGGLRISKDEAATLLQSAGIDPNLRPQNLELGQWYQLYKAVKESQK